MILEQDELSFFGILGIDPTKDAQVITEAFHQEAKNNHCTLNLIYLW